MYDWLRSTGLPWHSGQNNCKRAGINGRKTKYGY